MIENKKISLEGFKEIMLRQEKRKDNLFLMGGRVHTPFHHSGNAEFSGRYYRNFLTSILKEGVDLGSCYGTPYNKTNFGLLYSDYGEQEVGYSADFSRRKESITLFEAEMPFMQQLAKKIKFARNMTCLDNRDVLSEIEKFKANGGAGDCLFELNMNYSKDVCFGRKRWNISVNGNEVKNQEDYLKLERIIRPIRILPELTYL